MLALAIPVRAETTTDPLWYLLSTYVLAPDAKAVEAEANGALDAKGLAELQSDLFLLVEGFESFRDEKQVDEALQRIKPRMSPELRPFFKDRSSSLDAMYRTLAVIDYTWAQRFPEPPCAPADARRKLLESRDRLFETEIGEASPWLVSLLGPQARGQSAERSLDRASAEPKLTPAGYELLRAKVRKLTLALGSEKAAGPVRSKLYCSRAAALTDLAAHHARRDDGPSLAASAVAGTAERRPEENVFVVVWKDRRAAATLVQTKSGPVLLTDASVVADTDHPQLFAFSLTDQPIALKAEVARRNSQLNLAVLTYTDAVPRTPFVLAEKDPEKNELVTAFGHTKVAGLWTKTSGLVTKVGEGGFQTDASISPELTGGPVINESGDVAGILVLRRADTEEGIWPIGVPARTIARWLDDPSFQASDPATETIEDAGTAAVLNHTRQSSLTDAALGPWQIPGLPPPPPSPRGVCMNCSASDFSGGARSSYAGGSSSSSGELGQELGKLGAVLILKGIPALFRGLSKLFKGAGPSIAHAPSAPQLPAPIAVPKPEPPPPPPPPPKPTCEMLRVAAPDTAGAEPFTVAVRLSCDDSKIALAGHSVTFTFSWDGVKSTQAVTVLTDAEGVASLPIQVSNQETAVFMVRNAADQNFAELDRYAPAVNEMELAVDSGLLDTVEKPGAMTLFRGGNMPPPAKIFKLAGNGKKLEIEAAIKLLPAAKRVGVVLVASTVIFAVGWKIGSVANEKINDIQYGLKQYGNDDGDPCDTVLDRGQLRRARILGKEHSVKSDALGTKKNLAKFDICGCRDGRVVVKYHGCRGPVLAATPFTWK